MTEPTIAGWYRDPFGRYEKRYHTGTGWTEHVKNKGKVAVDPPQARLAEVPQSTGAPVAPAPRATPAPKPAPTPRQVPVPRPSQTPTPTHTPATPTPVRPPGFSNVPPPVAPARPAAAMRAAAPRPSARPEPSRGGDVAASRASVAVALSHPVNTRAPSSYLRPAPKMVTPAPEPTHRVRWPWVVVIIVVLVAIVTASGVGFIRGTATESDAAAPRPQRAPYTITDRQYDFVTVGTTRARVINGLDKLPADRSEYRRVFPDATTDEACAYYYGTAARRSYAFCFDAEDRLTGKTIRSLPATVPVRDTKAKAKTDAG